MIRSRFRTALLICVSIALTLALAGCGKGLSGKYADKGGILSVDFKPDNKATVSTYGGAAMEGTVATEGDKITITTPVTTYHLVRHSDGTMTIGEAGAKLEKL